jgi:hypothetical protein
MHLVIFIAIILRVADKPFKLSVIIMSVVMLNVMAPVKEFRTKPLFVVQPKERSMDVNQGKYIMTVWRHDIQHYDIQNNDTA